MTGDCVPLPQPGGPAAAQLCHTFENIRVTSQCAAFELGSRRMAHKLLHNTAAAELTPAALVESARVLRTYQYKVLLGLVCALQTPLQLLHEVPKGDVGEICHSCVLQVSQVGE